MFRPLAVVAALAAAAAAPVPKDAIAGRNLPNSNALATKHRAELKLDFSTQFGGWEATKAFDGDPLTSWFTASGDAAALGATPWNRATFPADVTVTRVTVLGNREPSFPTGYTVLAAKVDLLDAGGKLLATKRADAAGAARDIDVRFDRSVPGVPPVRVTSTKDEGDKNGSRDIAVAEVQIE